MADFTTLGLIVPHLRSRQASGVIEELAAVLQQEGRIPDGHAYTELVLRREAVASTALTSQAALPHARLPGLAQPWFALGCSETPLDWGGRPIQCVFLIAVPESETNGYLVLLSGLARSGLDRQLPQQLLKAQSAEHILEIFRGISVASRKGSTCQTGS